MTPGVEIAIISGVFLVVNTATAGIFNYFNNKNRKTDKAEVQDQIEQVHKTINSGLTVRIAEAKELGNLEGRAQQTQENKDK